MNEAEARESAQQAVQAALGPLQFRDERTAQAYVDGRAVLVEFSDVQTTRRGTHNVITLPFRATKVSVPLARPLPVLFGVENRRVYVHIGSTPEVQTTDASFDAAYFVFGSPVEVVAAALDAEVRSWIRSMGANPALGLEESIVFTSWATPGPTSQTTPEQLLRAARAQIYLADAIVRAYDARYAQLHAEAGAAAADAWHASAAARIERREEDRMRLRVMVVAVLGALAGAGLALAGLIVFAAYFAGC